MHALDGKVALVTGGGQGIGQGICVALASEGAAIAVVGRTESKLRTTCKQIEGRGGTAAPIVCDVGHTDDVADAVAATVSEFGTVDILVNNAQDIRFGPLLTLDDADLQTLWTSGFVGTLAMMQQCHPHLRDGGAIVNVGSGAVHAPQPGIGGYAAVKAAITTLSRTAALEFADDGIRVNTIVPFALTPAVQTAFDANPRHRDAAIGSVPLGRIGDPQDDIGRAVVFLCGPNAAYITGTVLAIDGGETHLR
jgi:NAD(P)-dependent dehydrogenase (short-subunit alcohol dehydrogenase family)